MMNSPFKISIIKGAVVDEIVRSGVSKSLDIVRDAYLAHAHGQTVNPDSYFLRFPDRPNARIIALPAAIGAGFDVSGIKWIASFPDNIKRGFPRASAAIILNDRETGYPFAILEGSIISAVRTAASAVLAARAIRGERRAETFLIVGTGFIARYVYRWLVDSGWELSRIVLFDADPAEARKFAEAVVEPARHRDVSFARALGAALSEADLALFTTTAATPHVSIEQALQTNGTLLHLSLRDLPPELLLRCNNVVDDVEHVMKASTSPHLTEQSVGHRRFVNGTLADVLEGRCTLDRSRPTIFSPFGLGVLNLAVSRWVYEEASQRGAALVLDDFFHDLSR